MVAESFTQEEMQENILALKQSQIYASNETFRNYTEYWLDESTERYRVYL